MASLRTAFSMRAVMWRSTSASGTSKLALLHEAFDERALQLAVDLALVGRDQLLPHVLAQLLQAGRTRRGPSRSPSSSAGSTFFLIALTTIV
jgi:hypothetical protein